MEVFHIVSVDDDPAVSKAAKRTLFCESREIEPEVFRGRIEDQEGETEFHIAYGLATFLQILERFTETKAKVDLVMLDGELGYSGMNLIPCHGLDIVQIAAALFGKCDFPENLRNHVVPGEEEKGTLEERFRRIPREVYEAIKFIIFSGAYSRGEWISSSGEEVDYMPRFRELDAKAPGLMQGLFGKPYDSREARSHVKRVLGVEQVR
jgi:hypothetical protein